MFQHVVSRAAFLLAVTIHGLQDLIDLVPRSVQEVVKRYARVLEHVTHHVRIQIGVVQIVIHELGVVTHQCCGEWMRRLTVVMDTVSGLLKLYQQLLGRKVVIFTCEPLQSVVQEVVIVDLGSKPIRRNVIGYPRAVIRETLRVTNVKKVRITSIGMTLAKPGLTGSSC